MKRIWIVSLLYCFIVILLVILSTPYAFAVYDPTSVANNKFGIHILFPEEIENAAKLVNSQGGDWGYVTIPIQSKDRNLDKWQNFLSDCKKLHIIPIIRLATYPVGPLWAKPEKFEAIDWANFLNSLSWPIKNRYIVVYNETNRAAEWGGQLKPDEYAYELADTYDAFKKRSEDFYILNAGFDAAAPTNHELMDLYQYLIAMDKAYPGIFKKIDGWVSHSYPNPAFSSHPYDYSRMGIRSYQHELSFLQNNFGIFGLKVFITETGWQNKTLGQETISQYFKKSFNEVWTDNYLVAITPFLLSAGGEFEKFAWFIPGKGETLYYKSIISLRKTEGKPEIYEEPKIAGAKISILKENYNNSYKAEKLPVLRFNKWNEFFKWLFNY